MVITVTLYALKLQHCIWNNIVIIKYRHTDIGKKYVSK